MLKAIRKYLFQGLLIVSCLGLAIQTGAQSLGEFVNPQPVSITDNGYGIGSFQSSTLDMAVAKLFANEYAPEALLRAGLLEKSVWFSFHIPTPRNISIQLAQATGNSQANDLGFAVYKNPIGSAGPHNFCPDIPVLEKMGSSGNTCLPEGTYYIQVVARLRVKSSIFIRLTSQLPNALWSSLLKPPMLSFGASNRIKSSLSQLNTANFEDESSASNFGNQGQTQLINFQFEVDSQYSGHSLQLGFSRLTPLLVLVLKEDSNSAIQNWQRIDSALFNSYSYSKIWDCSHGNQLSSGKYRVIITGDILAANYFQLELRRKKQGSPYSSDIRQLPNSQKLGDLSNTKRNIPLNMSCNTPILKDACTVLNQNLFRVNYYGDTAFFRYQLWYTFEIKEDNRLEMKDVSSYPNRFNGFWQLFHGDDASNCQMQLVQASSSSTYCLSPGTYSLRFLLYDDYWSLDIPYSINLSFQALAQHFYAYNDSLQPENLGNISTQLPVTAQGAYFDNQKQVLKISRTVQVEGSAQYREFYIAEKSQGLKIWADRATGSAIPNVVDNYLFKGRKSDGSKNLYLGQFSYSTNFPCGFEDTGWYTLVSMASIIPESCISLKEDLPYSPKFDFPETCGAGSLVSPKRYPVLVNGTRPLPLQESVNGIPVPTIFKYYPICFACSNEDETYQTWLTQNCSLPINDEKRAFNFYEFSTLDTGQLFISTGNFNFSYLIGGSVKNDTGLLYKKASYIGPCGGGSNYCKLSPGSYTLILANTMAITDSLKITFVSSASNPNDYIEEAKDLGLIAGKSLSDSFLIGCAFTIDSSDLYLNAVSKDDLAWAQNTASDVSIGFRKEGSIWYTFLSDGLGMLDIYCPAYSSLFLLNDSVNWQDLQGHPEMRASISENLNFLVAANKSSSIRYIEGNCVRNRYVLRIPYNGINRPSVEQLMLIWRPTQKNNAGNDFCSTAAALDITQVGQKSIQLDLRCLSLGGDFDEDDLKKSCLNLDSNDATAWLKVHIDIGKSYDAKFNVRALQSGLKSAIKYRVFRGDCGALTPVTCVESLDATFSFECADAGDYYFQIAYPANLNREIFAQNQFEVYVEVSEAAYAPCPLDDPFGLKASFDFSGQCAQDSIRFINYSSQGRDIEYLWDFGDGTQSVLKDPVILYPKSTSNQEYTVQLMVINKRLNKTDSFQRTVTMLADKLELWTSLSDTTVRCGSPLTIKAQTNLTGFSILYSINSGDTLTGDEVYQRFIQKSDIRFMVWGNGCMVEKNVEVAIDYSLGRISDTLTLCKDDSIQIDLAPYTKLFVFPGTIQVPQFSISSPGDYLVLVYDSSCTWTDNFHVKASEPIFKGGTRDTSACNLDSLKLETSANFQSIQWYDGSSSSWNWVKNTGLYSVEGISGNCRVSDTFYVDFKRTSPLFSSDSSFCEEDIFYFSSPIEGDSYLWNTQEKTKTIQISDSGIYWLRVQIAQCVGEDTIHFSYYPKDLDLGLDTGFCLDFSFQLDAGSGSDYSWWPSYSDSRYFMVKDSGTYGVEKTNQYGCYDADTIRIIENCGPYFLMPTAFSPNGDGTNDFLTWSNVDVTEFEIHIYNRWGEEVFSSTSISDSWDGSFEGSPALDGLYIYHLVYGGADYTGNYFRKSLKGQVLLVR